MLWWAGSGFGLYPLLSMISIGSSPMWNFRRRSVSSSHHERRTDCISTTDISRRPKLTPPIPGVLLTWETPLLPLSLPLIKSSSCEKRWNACSLQARMIATSSLHPRRFSLKLLSSAARRFRQKNNVGATGVGTLEESTTSSTTTLRFLTTESSSKQRFQEEGILDQDGLVQFDTLYEMQSRACAVFENNQLFGTFSESSESFDYMTYGEYGRKVNQCRMVLKDLGKWLVLFS